MAVNDDMDLGALRALVEGTAGAMGDEFFRRLVQHLAAALDVRHAFIAETVTQTRWRTLALWSRDSIEENLEWEIPGTLGEDCTSGEPCHHPAEVSGKFPRPEWLAARGIESYLGVPLKDDQEQVLGHLAVMDERPMPDDPRRTFIMRIFAARAAAELLRLRAEQRLRESDERFRDLFEEAPIAYVHEGLDSRFIRANRAAVRILGIKPEDVPGTLGMSFVRDTPENQRRLREAFDSIGRGTDTGGVVLELSRRDDGRPIWIEWWSRPDPGGKFTRTMFLDITDRVLMQREQAQLRAQNLYLQEELKASHNFEEIIGRSARMTAVLDHVAQVAPTDASVLIVGETGTGKELIARALHFNSQRRGKALIKVNCAALPAGLVESELFGHEKGAFSGAIARRIGRFELAHGGTIFLDEVGELPPEVQVKLLRVLQEREFERVGGGAAIQVDVRIIAATNRDLLQAVRDGRFREDLFYRLNVFPIHLPALRERAEDIPLLVQFLLKKFSMRIGKDVSGVSASTMARFVAYPWPGNVRELENVLERAVILARSNTLDVDPAVFSSPTAAPSPSASGSAPGPRTSMYEPGAGRPTSLEHVEREHLLAMLRQANWVIDGPAGAATILQVHPNTLRSRLKKLGIRRPAHDQS